VAVDPPEQVRERLAWWARAAAAAGAADHWRSSPLRLVHADMIHITLCFLGNRSAPELERIALALSGCRGAAEGLSLGAPLWLPKRRPRALAIEVHDHAGALGALQGQVMLELSREIELERPRRRFRAHLTVARMKSGAAPRRLSLPPTPDLAFAGESLSLYRSLLSSQGASYESLLELPLGPSVEPQER
jgi:2'-5' RNA ligase